MKVFGNSSSSIKDIKNRIANDKNNIVKAQKNGPLQSEIMTVGKRKKILNTALSLAQQEARPKGLAVVNNQIASSGLFN